MTDTKTIFNEKKFPTFITGHPVFKTFKEVRKVFPEIGLPNTETEVEVDNKKEAKDAASLLLTEINAAINKRLVSIDKYATKKSDMKAKRKKKFDNAKQLLTAVKANITKSRAKFLIINNGRITINLPTDVSDIDNKVAFKGGEGLFRVYNKLNETLRDGHFLAMPKIEDFYQFKEFSTKNVPALKYKVRFASDGSEGAWDIATMSMRGINSCQTWGGGNSTHIVGSIVDPFTGIIYLTSGGKFNEHGSKMIRRCVVRFVVDEKKKIPYIALERMYPSMEKGALDAFTDFLKKKTDNKFEIIYLDGRQRANLYVPMSKVVSQLNAYDQPYRDSGMSYKADINDTGGRVKEQVQYKLDVIYGAFASKVVASARGIKITSVPEASKKALKILTGRDYYNDYSYELYQSLQTYIKKFFADMNMEKYSNSDLYLKESIEALLKSNLEDTISGIVKSVADKIPKAYLKKHDNKTKKEFVSKFDDDTTQRIAQDAKVKLDLYFGGELKKIKIVETKGGGKKDTADTITPIYTKLLR
jgi:hypothetical protein